MDLLNLWNDDPEEILLDLGFGCDEPDLSGRIPTRFLNYQSYARGITIQVFLEAQKDRLNLENPDVSNRFRQLEVLQLVTKGFCSFMGSSSPLLKGKDLPSDVQERRKRISALFRLASKKSLGQIHNNKNQHRVEESGVTGSSTGGETSEQRLILTESDLSGSSGSLEEPFISTIPQLASPGPDHVKVLSGLSVQTADNQSNGNSETSPSIPFLSLSLTTSVVDHLPSSPSFSPESPVFHTSLDMIDVPKSDLKTSDNKTPTIQGQPPPISPSEPQSPSDKSNKMSDFQSGVHRPHVQFTSVVSTSKPISLISDQFKTLDSKTQSTTICAVSHDSEDTTCFAFSLVSSPDSSLSPSPNFRQCQFFASTSTPSTQLDFSEKSWSKQYAENFISASAWLSSLCLSSSYLHPSSPSFLCPPSLVPQTLIKSMSDSHKDNQEDFCSPQPKGIDLPDDSCQLNIDHTFSPPSVFPDSMLEDRNTTMTSAASAGDASAPPANPDSLIPPADGSLSDLANHPQQVGRVLLQQEIKSCDNSGSPPASSVKDNHFEMDPTSLDEGGTLQRSENRDGVNGGHPDVVKTFTQSETKTAARLHDEQSAKTKQKEFRGNSEMEMKGTQSDSPFSSSILYDQFLQAHNRTEVKPNHGKTESLVVVLETSVDDSDGENGDADAFCQQLDTDEQVYWAEPVHVTPMSEELSSHEDSDIPQFSSNPFDPESLPSTGESLSLQRSSSAMSVTNQSSRNTAGASDTSSSVALAPLPSPCSTSNLKHTIPSVSVSMSSGLSSHIVSRKDVPYRTESHPNNLHSNVLLDTSTPLRAVQSWADLRIQRISLTNNLSHRSFQTIPNSWSLRAAGATQTPSGSLLVPQSVPQMSNKCRSHESISKTGGGTETVSVSVNAGLWTDVLEDVDTNENEEHDKLWEANKTMNVLRCCHCDHQCPRKFHDKQHSGNVPYSLDELEEMMMCLQQFRSVLSDIEEQSSEDQAAVYSVLSTADREDVQSLEKLRCAVKLEAEELEMQLKELAHHYDESLKAKMHTLLDEQYLLCSQVLQPWTVPTSSPDPNRTVSSPNRLLPTTNEQGGDVPSGKSTTQVLPASVDISECQGTSPSAADKLDFLGLLQKCAPMIAAIHTSDKASPASVSCC